MTNDDKFSDRCPPFIGLAKVGIVEWDSYINGWKEAQETAPEVFPNKIAYDQYLKSCGFSSAARMAASVIWDLYMLEIEDAKSE